jgi:hypothetical protein
MTTTAQLDALIDELTVDAYGDDEQLTGFLTGAEEALGRGEPAQIVGIDVEVLAVDAGPDVRTGLTARVKRGDATYQVGLADLAFPEDSQLGIVVAAYRRWQGRGPRDQYRDPRQRCLSARRESSSAAG